MRIGEKFHRLLFDFFCAESDMLEGETAARRTVRKRALLYPQERHRKFPSFVPVRGWAHFSQRKTFLQLSQTEKVFIPCLLIYKRICPLSRKVVLTLLMSSSEKGETFFLYRSNRKFIRPIPCPIGGCDTIGRMARIRLVLIA